MSFQCNLPLEEMNDNKPYIIMSIYINLWNVTWNKEHQRF